MTERPQTSSPDSEAVTESNAASASAGVSHSAPGSPARKTVSAFRIYALLLVLLVLVLGVFAAGYLRLVHYRPRLQSHVPNTAVFALHVNLQQVVYFEPVRRYLFPWFQASGFHSPVTWERLQHAADVNLTMDLREVLLTVTQSGDWVLGVSGRFDGTRLYRALAQEWTESGLCTSIKANTVRCARAALLCTEDGSLLLGTSLQAVEESAAESERGAALGLRPTSAFTWGAALDELGTAEASEASRLLLAAGVTRFSGSIEPENPLRGEVWLRSNQGSSPDAPLNLLKNAVSVLPPAARQLGIELLREAKSEQGGAGSPTATLETTFPRSLLMESFERFVAWFSLAHPATP